MFTRVLIVDDELLARNRLRTIINWEDHGYVLCGEAEDGISAIEAVRILHPQIVLADVHMPLMDGVTLCQYISRNHKEISTIVLSNFDNFDYVRDSLSFGAVDYLLKHRLDSVGLLNTLSKASTKSTAGTGSILKNSVQHEVYDRQHPIALQTIIRQLTGQEELSEQSRDFLKQFAKNTIIVVIQMLNNAVISDRHSTQNRDIFLRSILALCRQMIGDNLQGDVAFLEEQERLVFVLSYAEYRSETPILQSVHAFAERTSETLGMIYNVGTSYGNSPICHDLDKLSAYYLYALDALENKLGLTEGKKEMDASVSFRNSDMILTLWQEKDLLAAILACDPQQTDAIIEGIFDEFARRDKIYPYLSYLIEEFTSLAHRTSKRSGQEINWTFKDTFNWRPKTTDLKEVRHWIQSLYRALIEGFVRMQLGGNYSPYIEQTIKLIRAEYRRGISLEEAAKAIGITPSYLSRQFKEESGKTFVEFINHYRVGLSKLHIENGNRGFKDMHLKFGFNSYNYFIKVFKDIVGETPQAYARRFL